MMFAIGSNVWPGLLKLVEECGEVVQVCGKLLGTGGSSTYFDDSDLREQLTEELADLLAAAQFVIEHNGLDAAAIEKRVAEKRRRFEDWHASVNEALLVEDLDISVRLANILQAGGCVTIKDAQALLGKPEVWTTSRKAERELRAVLAGYLEKR
jgi:NTP pyrophosphatase (non-canonical NTP hydrolase)